MPSKNKDLEELDDLINDVDSLCTQEGMNRLLSEEMDSMIASVLREMGSETIMDTGQARSIFVDIARDYFGVEISDIYTDVTNIWGNLKHGRDVYNFKPYTIGKFKKNGLAVDINIEDDGVYGQEVGIDGYEHPSPSRPDYEDYESGHLTYVAELANSGNLPEFEFFVNAIINKIIDRLEGRI